MGMDERGLGVDLLEELLARHRRREHAEGPLGGAAVSLGGRRRATIRQRDRVEACADVQSLAIRLASVLQAASRSSLSLSLSRVLVKTRSAQTGKVSQGKGEKRPRPRRPRPRRPRRARQYPTGAQLKRPPASPTISA